MFSMWYYANAQRVEMSNPPVETVRAWLGALDHERRTCFHIKTDAGRLSIARGERGRVAVSFRAQGQRIPLRLRDPFHPDGTRQSVRVYSGSSDSVPLHLTVSENMALDVVRYFIDHRCIPDGLEWAQA